MSEPFPVNGVIALVANTPDEVDQAIRHGLTSIEVRADLLLDNGLSTEQVMDLVANARAGGLAVLFTLRHPTHGGRFAGTEQERATINRRAMEAGANVVDAEFGSELAAVLLAEGLPVVLSQHDFEGMPNERELADMTRAMTDMQPLALKIVPTAATISDAARMLDWVANADSNGPRRIGFAMGAAGTVSRILTIAYGSPITYTSFGAALAPGQVPMRELLEVYRADQLGPKTRVYGVAGTHALTSFSPFLHNAGIRSRGLDAVYVPLQTDDFDALLAAAEALRIDGLSVTIPYKERALAIADEADGRSRACGASNTLVFDRSGAGMRIRACNTDFDGVTLPIEAHRPVQGLRVAIVGNGGAARGAVQALREKGAEVTLFYRNPARGEPVASELGVPGRTLDSLDASFDVIINATPMGTNPGDPSPVPASVLARPEQIAFEMLYQNPNSPFLADARAAGLRQVRGSQMLVAQGTTQFEHFFGTRPSLEEFEAAFEAGTATRAGRTI